MGFHEENELYDDSFSKAICSIKSLAVPGETEEDAPHGDYTISATSSGMYEMADRFDIVNGQLAKGFFNALGPMDGHKFSSFRKKMGLLHDRNMRDLERAKQEQESGDTDK